MKTVIITTTINVPENLREWAKQLSINDAIVVAGDLKTPHDEVQRLLDSLESDCGAYYIHPKDQEQWASSEVIGWNSIQRRNIALLEALALQPEVIITIDDDNYPVRTYHVGYTHEILTWYDNSKLQLPVRHASSGWYNIGQRLTPSVVHRGYPLSQRLATTKTHDEMEYVRPGVFASLWLGDPDIDAIERIAKDPQITGCAYPVTVLGHGTWCPFNSQATAYRADLAPLMSVWPGVGRFDDIWGSYLARRVLDDLGYHVVYGDPFVRQDRNPHNLIADLQAEMHGYRHTDKMCDTLRNVDFTHIYKSGEPRTLTAFSACVDALQSLTSGADPVIPPQTMTAFRAWQQDLLMLRRNGVTFA